ncbi:MAG: MBL fold metallo-hydrolase [Asgard group archaeon]|nr:MBL fold metallo-hydrolase [Asgard group archaeon]
MIKLDQISDSVWDYCTPIYEGHISIIKLKNKLVFIDSGREPITAKNVRLEAEKQFKLPAKQLILTHQHWDHVFGNQAFKDCEIISSKATLEDMKSYMTTYWTDENIAKMKEEEPETFADFRIVFPNITFEREYQITDEKITIEIYQGDGHSAGNSYIFIPEEKILITGDLLFSGMTPFFGDPNADIFTWLEVYQNMLDLSPKKIIPGHGEITDKGEILNQINYFERCINWMKKYIENGYLKEELDTRKDFPVLKSMDIEGFDELVKSSIRRTYDVVKEKLDG